MTTIHESTVRSVGSATRETLDAGYIITYGEGVPDSLAEYCFLLQAEINSGCLSSGMTLHIGQTAYPITATGFKADKNLKELGHITIRFDGSETPTVGGSVHVAGDVPDHIESGSLIRITDG